MVECCKCREWFHPVCVGLEEDVVEEMDEEFTCPKCFTSIQLDSKRQVVVDGLEAALEVSEQSTDATGAIAALIEAALFAFCEQAVSLEYRQKYRTMVSNLRDPRSEPLRLALMSGELKPEDFVRMETVEMANAEVAAEVELAKAEAIKSVTRTEVVDPVDDHVPEGDVGLTETETIREKYSKEVERPVEYGNDMISASFPQTGVDDTLQKSKDASSVHVQTMGWAGSVVQADSERVLLSKCQLFSMKNAVKMESKWMDRPHRISSLLPVNLHVGGRIPMQVAMDYVRQIMDMETSREVLILGASEVVRQDGMKLAALLAQQKRWIVVAHDPATGMRDFYIAPSTTEICEHLRLSDAVDLSDLLLIIVVSRDGRPGAPAPQTLYDPLHPIY